MSDEEKLKDLENSKEFQEYKKKQAELSERRIETISRMVKSHFSALTPENKLNAIEMFQLGIDTIIAGYGIVSRYSDMVGEEVDGQKDMILRPRSSGDDILSRTLLNEDVLKQQVLNTTVHNLKANKLIK